MPQSPRAPLICAGILFFLNSLLIRDLFRIEYLDQMGSIEGAYIGISRYMMENWRDLSWFPLWYGGIPFQNTYPPLLHALVAIVAKISGGTAAWAHHAVTAGLYSLGSVATMWLVTTLSSDWRRGALAGLMYSVLSPSAWLITAIRHDAGGALYPRRLQNLVQYGEGPHLASLLLLPLAIGCLHRALDRRRPFDACLATLACAAVALSNYLGLFALVAMAACYLLARETRPSDWLRAALIGVAAYALAAPWIPPSTLLAVRTNAQWVGGAYPMGWPQALWIGTGALAVLAGSAVLKRAQVPLDVRFWSLASLVFAGLVLPAFWFGSYALPQPERYHLEMEMALIGLAAVLAARHRVTAVAMIALSIAGAFGVREYARTRIRPIDIASTVEYRMAKWLETNAPGERVFLPGSAYIWLNAFTSQPQLGGGFDQGITNPLLPAVFFQSFSGMNAGEREGEIAVALLKAFGVQAVAVGGPKSREFYKPYRNPHKFNGLLPEIWREGDDAIYRVPYRFAPPVHVVTPDALPPRILDVTQTQGLSPYIAALDDTRAPSAPLTWKRPGAFEVTGQFQRQQVLAIQMTYDRGWEARVGDRDVALRADNLGMMIANPECDVACTVQFEYTGGLEMTFAKLARMLVFAAGVLWLLWYHRAFVH